MSIAVTSESSSLFIDGEHGFSLIQLYSDLNESDEHRLAVVVFVGVADPESEDPLPDVKGWLADYVHPITDQEVIERRRNDDPLMGTTEVVRLVAGPYTFTAEGEDGFLRITDVQTQTDHRGQAATPSMSARWDKDEAEGHAQAQEDYEDDDFGLDW